MKYRLKKDLPFAKIGAEVEFHIYCDYNPQITHRDGKLIFYIKTEEEIKQLISEDFIEEVKPREFYLLDDEELDERIFYHNMDEVKRDVADWAVKDLIKVIEVIE